MGSRPKTLKNENIFDVKKAQNFLNSVTAPWIQDLNHGKNLLIIQNGLK